MKNNIVKNKFKLISTLSLLSILGLTGCSSSHSSYNPENAREIKLSGQNNYALDTSGKSGWQFEVDSVHITKTNEKIFEYSFFKPLAYLNIGPNKYTVKVSCYFNNVQAGKRYYRTTEDFVVDLNMREAVTFSINEGSSKCRPEPKYRKI